jgi:hypothetical protein
MKARVLMQIKRKIKNYLVANILAPSESFDWHPPFAQGQEAQLR